MKWEKVKLEDIVKLTKGKKHSEVDDTNAYRYLQIEDLHGSGTDKYTNEDGVLCDPSDLLIAWDGANAGKVGTGLHGMAGSTLARISVTADNVSSKYLYWYLSSNFEVIKSKRTGATIPHVNGSELRSMMVPLPPLHIQEQIADTLDKADALRRKDQELLQKYDQLAQAIFYDMFGDPLRNEKMWEQVGGKDAFVFSSGKFNPTKNLNDNYPYPTYGGNGITGYSSVSLINFQTIVIGRVGAYCGSVHLTEKESWITDNAIYIKSGLQENDLTFLLFLFKKLNLNQYADYSGQPKITQKPLENINYIKPPLIIQKKFGDIIASISKSKSLLSSGKIEDLNSVLFSKYFS